MEAELQRDGWALSEKGLEYCKSICGSKNLTKKSIVINALHTDLREIGKQSLPADINKAKNSQIHGPFVLQIQKIKNISAPNAKEDSSFAPRMLKLMMTDGVITCAGIELEMINCISLATPPGSKICLMGTLTVQHGFILLDSGNVKFLGGEVEHLKSKWEISKNVSKIQRKVMAAEGGPPLFAPFEEADFAQRKPKASSVIVKHADANFKLKGKSYSNQTEKPTKSFEDKKIWKSEPFDGRKDINPKGNKDRESLSKDEARSRPESQQTAKQPSQSNEFAKMPSSRKIDDKAQKGSFKDHKDGKDAGYDKRTSHKDVKSKEGWEKDRRKGEDRRSKDYSKGARNMKDDKLPSEKEKSKGAQSRDNDGNYGKEKQRGNTSHERNEDSSYSKRYQEERVNNTKASLPPRLEKLKHQREEGSGGSKPQKLSYEEASRSRNSNQMAKDSKDRSGVDKDMKQVTELLNERMRIDDERSTYKEVDRSRGQKGKGYGDDYHRSSTRAKVDSKGTERANDGKKNRVGGDVMREEQSKRDGKEFERRGSIDERDRRHSGRGYDSRGRGYESRGRGSESRGRGYESQGRGSESRGRGYEFRGRGSESRGRGYESHGRGYESRGSNYSSEGRDYRGGKERRDENDRNWQKSSYSKEKDLGQSEKTQQNLHAKRAKPEEENYNDAELTNKDPTAIPEGYNITMQPESEARLTGNNAKSNEMSSVMHNNFMDDNYRMLNQQALSDQHISHTSIQSHLMTPNGQLVYSCMPTAMYQLQGYPSPANHEFQSQGYQPAVRTMRPNSFQQMPAGPIANMNQDFRFLQSAAPYQNFPHQGMQHTGHQARPRVRHDVYRPKRN